MILSENQFALTKSLDSHNCAELIRSNYPRSEIKFTSFPVSWNLVKIIRLRPAWDHLKLMNNVIFIMTRGKLN